MRVMIQMMNQPIIFLLLILQLCFYIHPCLSYDPKIPPKPVKEVCRRSGDEQYGYCIAVFNTGSVENADMRFLAYYTRDFAENNATNAMQRINGDLIPYMPDPYIQQVLTVCNDAFTKLKEELLNRVNPMITTKGNFREAKAWVNYGIGLMYSCRAVCTDNPQIKCPLTQNINDTQGVLKLLSIVLDLLTEGFI